ncbi:MAG: hypothetical protein QOJ99_5517 [Bryobacterales bacterium]|nr:hypothetical protein [Bryobacterales bacterium]
MITGLDYGEGARIRTWWPRAVYCRDRAGMSEAKARWQALLQFGGPAAVKEKFRDERGIGFYRNAVAGRALCGAGLSPGAGVRQHQGADHRTGLRRRAAFTGEPGAVVDSGIRYTLSTCSRYSALRAAIHKEEMQRPTWVMRSGFWAFRVPRSSSADEAPFHCFLLRGGQAWVRPVSRLPFSLSEENALWSRSNAERRQQRKLAPG